MRYTFNPVFSSKTNFRWVAKFLLTCDDTHQPGPKMASMPQTSMYCVSLIIIVKSCHWTTDLFAIPKVGCLTRYHKKYSREPTRRHRSHECDHFLPLQSVIGASLRSSLPKILIYAYMEFYCYRARCVQEHGRYNKWELSYVSRRDFVTDFPCRAENVVLVCSCVSFQVYACPLFSPMRRCAQRLTS